MLTPKQENYVRNLVKGMSQREAYKKSYDAKNMKDETIDKKASELFKQEKIRGRYEELQKQIDDDTIMSAIERQKWLTGVLKNEVLEDIYVRDSDGVETKVGSRNADLNTKMKAMDILNKMNGDYITKVEGNLTVEKLEDVL